jgi:hypothetical protein
MLLRRTRQHVGNHGALADIGRGGAVETQLAARRVDRARALQAWFDIGFRALRTLSKHIGAATDLATDQTAFAQQLIGPADGADGRADVIGEVALRRQFCTGIDDALVDI